MSALDVIRGWKDEEYRRRLSDEQRAMLPAHPAGIIELADEELDAAGGTLITFIPMGTLFLCHTAFMYGEDLCFPMV